GLKTPPPSAPRRIEFDYSRLIGTLGGTFSLNDQARRVEVGLTDLKATAEPQVGAGSIALNFTTGAGHVVFEGRRKEIDQLALAASMGEAGAQITKLELKSPVAN